MGKKKRNNSARPHATGKRNPDRRPKIFPSTRLSVIRAAAHDDWNVFYDEYLDACTHEVAIACRARGHSEHDINDLAQELLLRLRKRGGFGQKWQSLLVKKGGNAEFVGNVPAKYLYARRYGPPFAKFRTYLKTIIRNHVLEFERKRRAQPEQADSNIETKAVWLDECIGKCLDRNWVLASLEGAAIDLKIESRTATTKAKKRFFAALYFTTVERLTHDQLAAHFGIHRTTAASLVRDASQRFIRLLEQMSGVEDREFLRQTVASAPSRLIEAIGIAGTAGLTTD